MRLHEEKKKLRQKNTQKRLEKQASDMAHKATSNASMGMAALLSQVCSIWEVEVDERDKKWPDNPAGRILANAVLHE